MSATLEDGPIRTVAMASSSSGADTNWRLAYQVRNLIPLAFIAVQGFLDAPRIRGSNLLVGG